MTTAVGSKKTTPPRIIMPRKANAVKTLTREKQVKRELVEARAYELFLDRSKNGEHGDQLSDWLAAEEELSSGSPV